MKKKVWDGNLNKIISHNRASFFNKVNLFVERLNDVIFLQEFRIEKSQFHILNLIGQ